jgi:hypothetical protein
MVRAREPFQVLPKITAYQKLSTCFCRLEQQENVFGAEMWEPKNQPNGVMKIKKKIAKMFNQLASHSVWKQRGLF